MLISRLNLPWDRLDRGTGFFVPCLDFKGVSLALQREALRYGLIDVHIEPGIMAGYAGLYVFRRPRRKPALPDSAPSEDAQ